MSHSHQLEVVDSDAVSVNHLGKAISAEDAYRVYAMGGGSRSMRATADILGLPHGTVLTWGRRYRWTQRLRDTDVERVEGIAEAVVIAVASQVVKSVVTLANIRDDEEASPMARVEASKTIIRKFQEMGGDALGRTATSKIEEEEEMDLEEMVQTPEGVMVLMDRHRKRTGRG